MSASDLLGDMSNERAKALLAELTFDQLCALTLAKATLEGKRVNIRIRPAEARMRVRKGIGHGTA